MYFSIWAAVLVIIGLALGIARQVVIISAMDADERSNEIGLMKTSFVIQGLLFVIAIPAVVMLPPRESTLLAVIMTLTGALICWRSSTIEVRSYAFISAFVGMCMLSIIATF